MANQFRLVSSDSHVIEPPTLWSERTSKRFVDRAPRIVSEEHGDWWYIDGVRMRSFSPGIQPGVRFQGQDKLRWEGRFAEVRPGAYVPSERVKDLDMDGVSAEVLYPTIGLVFFHLQDSELVSAISKVYNDWIAEFTSAFPKRLKGLALVNLDDVQEGVGELKRAAKLGLAGALISVYPGEERSYALPLYEPFWAAAQDLAMPLSLHFATNRLALHSAAGPQNRLPTINQTPSALADIEHWVKLSLADIIFAGVFERYPKLKVGSVEHEVGWAAHFVRAMDYAYTQRLLRKDWHRFKGSALPSDFFHRNVFMSFQEDQLGIQLRSVIGVDTLMWGSDFPHIESTFPRTREILGEILEGVPEGEQQRIVGGNAALLYRL